MTGSIDHRPDFVYVIYIAAPQAKVWEALTNGDYTEQFFFGTRPQSDWKVGGTIKLIRDNDVIDVEGTLLECDPPRLLAYVWNTPTWTDKEPPREQPTSVSFKLDPFGTTTRLTLTHSHLIAADLADESQSPRGLNNGWPIILSSLKSLLETGRVPPILSEQAVAEAREGS